MTSPLTNRVFALSDQLFFSASNFIITIALARFFPSKCLAAYGVGMTIAFVFQGLHRTTFVVPSALLDQNRFERRLGALTAQNLITLLFSLLVIGAIFLCLQLLTGSQNSEYLEATISCTLIYFSADFDRTLLYKRGLKSSPTLLSFAYFITAMGLALASHQQLIAFRSFLLLQSVFAAVKILIPVLLTERPRFKYAFLLLLHSLKANFGWATVGTLASAGYSNFPLLILRATQNDFATAAFIATRSPLQPFALLTRSLDTIDKIRFASVKRGEVGGAKRKFWVLIRLYATVSACLVVTTAFGGHFLLRLFVGTQYADLQLALSLWALVFALTTIMLPLETIVYRENGLRTYAVLQLVAGVVSTAIAWPLSKHFGTNGAVGACLVGVAFVVFASWSLIVRPIVGSRSTAKINNTADTSADCFTKT